MQLEIDSIIKNNGWTLTDSSDCENVIKSKWIFKKNMYLMVPCVLSKLG